MPTPRHAIGAVVIGDGVHVAGGGVKSAINGAFTPG